jgi:hypothetical protein
VHALFMAGTNSHFFLFGRQKAYKEQFDVWQWKKKLPKEVAQFMTEKAKKRKREAQKDTLFSYGGKKWTRARAEKSVARSKPGQEPSGVHCKRPRPLSIFRTPLT